MKNNYFDEKYFKHRDYLDPKIASSVENLADRKNLKRILDVGCGTGKLVKYLNSKGFKAQGCDPYVKLAKGKIFVKARATKLPYKNGSLDLVTNISVIEHLKKSEATKFLSETTRVLKNGGYIFLVTPNYNSIWRRVQGKKWFGYSDPTHINFYTPNSLAKLLKKHGFKNINFQFRVRNLGLINYLIVSTPFWRIRDSFYISAQK